MKDSFYLAGSGKVRYSVGLSNGDSLPPWLVFLPSEYMFFGSPSEASGSFDIKLAASNDVVLSDTFTLTWDKKTADPNLDEESRSDYFIINQELLVELNKAIDEKILEVKTASSHYEERLDSLRCFQMTKGKSIILLRRFCTLVL